MNYLLRLVIIGLTAILSGCASPSLIIKFNANHTLNPDITNQSLPVEVVIYQLRDTQTFTQATFDELWHGDKAILGSSLLSRDEVNVIPGGKMQIVIKRDNDATYIGVMAIFRNPEAGHWRLIKKLGHKTPMLNAKIDVDLIGYSIK